MIKIKEKYIMMRLRDKDNKNSNNYLEVTSENKRINEKFIALREKHFDLKNEMKINYCIINFNKKLDTFINHLKLYNDTKDTMFILELLKYKSALDSKIKYLQKVITETFIYLEVTNEVISTYSKSNITNIPIETIFNMNLIKESSKYSIYTVKRKIKDLEAQESKQYKNLKDIYYNELHTRLNSNPILDFFSIRYNSNSTKLNNR
jgi:hypothetical protein